MTVLPASVPHAHVYAEMGWPVMRLRGKLPVTEHGVHDATRDHQQIATWPPTGNIGIRCDSLLVVDIDPRHGGDTEMRRLVGEHGPLPQTLVARTGGGGWHYLFRGEPERLRGKLSRGIDLKRNQGGYIVAPPSVHPDTGQPYRWLSWGTPVAAAPEWLLELARYQEPPAPRRDDVVDTDAEYRRARSWLSHVEGAVSGQHGHDATYRVACRLAARGITRSQAWGLLVEWNQRCSPPWSEADLRRKLDQALEA